MKKYLLLLLGVIFLSGCANMKPTTLDNVEISDYEGQDLSSVNDFRENSIKGVQQVDINNYKLEITGLVDKTNYTYEQALNHSEYSKVITFYCVEGWQATILWEGVLVKDLLKNIKPSANTIIFYAVDGYSTSFPLSYILDNNIILAYKMNNATIIPERGYPFQLVAESKWGYKWIKWVNRIELSNNTDYEGYWEKRGYSNTGNLSEEFLEWNKK